MVGGRVDEEAGGFGLHVMYQALNPRHDFGLVEQFKGRGAAIVRSP